MKHKPFRGAMESLRSPLTLYMSQTRSEDAPYPARMLYLLLYTRR
jgi:hypothetical protein